jgi:hypothetical protein
MKGSTASNSAYSDYPGLLEPANQSAKNAAFAVVGTSNTLGFGDRYYAGITPLNDTWCDYKIVIHLNQTLNETQMNELAGQWQMGTSLYGIDSVAPQFKGSYVILSAKGDIDVCLNDMRSSGWYFIKE